LYFTEMYRRQTVQSPGYGTGGVLRERFDPQLRHVSKQHWPCRWHSAWLHVFPFRPCTVTRFASSQGFGKRRGQQTPSSHLAGTVETVWTRLPCRASSEDLSMSDPAARWHCPTPGSCLGVTNYVPFVFCAARARLETRPSSVVTVPSIRTLLRFPWPLAADQPNHQARRLPKSSQMDFWPMFIPFRLTVSRSAGQRMIYGSDRRLQCPSRGAPKGLLNGTILDSYRQERIC